MSTATANVPSTEADAPATGGSGAVGPAERLSPKPSIGRIVRYRLSEADAKVINIALQVARENVRPMDGTQVYECNDVSAGDSLPMIVTAVWPDESVNGQVFLDGNATYWARTCSEGDDNGDWSWPPLS